MDTHSTESVRHQIPNRTNPILRARRALETGEREATALKRIERSLDRVVRGTYGICDICHAPIETERVRAFPEADRCSGCSHR
jgi:RNA polymerase-binding transcription factor DksA